MLAYTLPLFIVVVATILVARYRKGPLPYVAFGVAIGAAAGFYADSLALGTAAAVASLLLFATVNYPIQLVLDHKREIGHTITLLSGLKGFRFLIAAALPWSIALVFALAGMKMHEAWVGSARLGLYNSSLILLDRNSSERFLERDLLFTVNEARSAAQTDAVVELSRVSGSANEKLAEVPEIVDSAIISHRPSGVPDRSCDGFATNVLFVSIPLDALCRHLIWLGNVAIQNGFNHLRQQALSAAVHGRDSGLKHSGESAQDAAETTRVVLNAYFDKVERGVQAVFLFGRAASLTALIMLIGALMSAFLGALVRVLFATESGFTFSLGQSQAAAAESMLYAPHKRLALDAFGVRKWFVARSASRFGSGTCERVQMPQMGHCVIARLLTNRYLLTEVSTGKLDGANGQGPMLTSDTGQLVAIRIGRNQRVVFRMGTLIAFSDGVTLSARFSTHLSLFFLGLRRFYSSAHGSGVIVLRSGPHVIQDSQGLSTPVGNLLAWDSRQSFSFDQAGGPLSMWINVPSVRLRSPHNLAVVHEAPGRGPSLVARVWRLLRFLFLPL